MVNCISPFVLVTLKRSPLNYLSATEHLLFDKHSVHFPLAEGISFHFIEFYFVTTYNVL